MLPRERVINTIRRQPADRIPIYGWVSANLCEPITAAFGSIEGFEDHYEFDYAHLFGGPAGYADDTVPAGVEPPDLLDIPMTDPNDLAAYDNIREGIRHHKEERGRFVYVQTPGIFEANNGVFGIENHLAYLRLYEEEIAAVYRRQAEWNRAFAMNCLDLGVDMVHVSDDWGAQRGLLFHPDLWWQLIYPNHKITCDAVLGRGAFLSLHSDGNVNQVIDGIIDLGYHVVHPWQESAGMSLGLFHQQYRDRFTVMGGLDVQSTIGFGKLEVLEREITRVLRLFADGGLLFCTTHFVQDHCSIDELTFAYDLAYRLVRELGTG